MLTQNGHLQNQLPLNFRGGGTIVGNRANYGRGDRLNWFVGDNDEDHKNGFPTGYLEGGSWMLPLTPGAMSANYTARIGIVATASGVLGMPGTGLAEIVFGTPDLTGQLITSGSGASSIAFASNAPLLTASLNGAGTASVSMATNTPTLGAEASISGSATATFSGSITPYAVGSMTGTTVDSGVLTADSITAAIWSALSGDHNEAGTMGAKLNTASSGGVDYSALADAVLAALNATTIPVDMQKTNGVEIIGDGSEGNKFRSVLVP